MHFIRKKGLCPIIYLYLFCFKQIRVEAYDNGLPAKTDVAIVKVQVNRNLNAPKFDQTKVDLSIQYSQELGVPITSVKAVDEDPQVCMLTYVWYLF